MKAAGSADEAEFLGIEQQQVRCEPSHVLREQRDLEQQLRLGLAARQLHRGHRLVSHRKAETPARGLAVDDRDSACRSRPRIPTGSCRCAVRRASGLRHRRESRPRSPAPRAPRCSAWPAACGCSRAAPSAPCRAARASSASATASARLPQLVGGIAQVQPQRREHLIVARAAGMQAAAAGTDARGQQILDGGLAIFLLERNAPVAARVFLADGRQSLADRREILRRQQAPAAASISACAMRGSDVVAHQAVVEAMVIAGGVAQARARRAALPCPRAASCAAMRSVAPRGSRP